MYVFVACSKVEVQDVVCKISVSVKVLRGLRI